MMFKRKTSTKLIALIICCMVSVLAPMTARAASKDVTKKYKNKVQAVIGPFTGYLGFGCDKMYWNVNKEKKTEFVFNDYARSTMLCMKDWTGFSGKTLKQLKKAYRKAWKKTFTADFNFKMKKATGLKRDETYNLNYTVPFHSWSNASYLIQINKKTGKAQYYGGDWGGVGPRGYVKKVVQKNKTSYIVTYDIYWWDEFLHEKGSRMGSYKITLQKNGGSFKIDDIKRTKALANI